MNSTTRFYENVSLLVLAGAFVSLLGVGRAEDTPALKLQIGNAVELSFDTEAGKFYQVEISDDLGNWENEGYSIKGNGGRVSTLVRGRSLEDAYFRVRSDGDPANVMPVGPPGKSAYEIWLEAGNLGTESEFLESIPSLPAPTAIFATNAATEASAAATAPDYLVTQGLLAPGDGGGARFKRVASEPSHGGKLSVTLDDGETVVWYEIISGTLRPEMFGGFPDDSSDAAAAAAKALAVIETRGGGVLSFEGAGTYRLYSQGDHPGVNGKEVAVYIPCDNVEIIIGPNATLKLADDQQSGGAPAVDVISWGDGRSNLVIHGGGTLLGNTAGQEGWTAGYTQNSSGNLISCYGGGSRIRIEKLRLRDCFSNPVNLFGRANSRLTDITLRGLRCGNTGEGAQIISADGVVVEDHVQEDDLDIEGNRGDGFELADCTRFRVSGITIKATGRTRGGAIDLFGSRDGVVHGFLIDGWNHAFDMESTASGDTVDRVLISNGIIRNLTSPFLLRLSAGRLVYSDIEIYDCPLSYVVQINKKDTDSFPPVVLRNVWAQNVGGLIVRGKRKLVWHGGGIRDSVDGILLAYDAPGDDLRQVDLADLKFSGIDRGAIRVSGGPEPLITVAGRMDGIRVDSQDDFVATHVGDFSNCEINGFSPKALASDTSPSVAPFEVLTRSAGNLATLKNPSKDQRLLIRATGDFTVIDATSAGGQDIHLKGGADFEMKSGDRLSLDHDGTGWYEVSRSEN